MSISELIRRMSEAGAPMDAILIAIEAIEGLQKADAERRAKDAERKRRSRGGDCGQSRDSHGTVTGQSRTRPVTVTVTSPPQGSSPLTLPLTPTPPSSPPSGVRTNNARVKGGEIDDRSIDDWFEEFWSIYPKRDGGNPRKPAAEKFEKLVRKTFHPTAIIDGARNYAEACRRDGRFGTSFVKQAATWLNQHGWQDDYLPTSSSMPQPAQPQKQRDPAMWRKGVILWLEDGRWLFGHEPTPDDPKTEVPPDVLDEFCVSPGRHWMDCRRDWLAKIGGRDAALKAKADLGLPVARSVVAA